MKDAYIGRTQRYSPRSGSGELADALGRSVNGPDAGIPVDQTPVQPSDRMELWSIRPDCSHDPYPVVDDAT